jgi:phosphatidate cytidylyltransferase
MKSRILTALLLFPPVIYLIGWAPAWLFLIAVLVVVALGLHEYFGICHHAGFKPLVVVGYVGAAAVCIAPAVEIPFRVNPALTVLALLILLTLGLGLLSARDLTDYLGAVSTTVLGFVYIGFGLSCLIPLRHLDGGEGRKLLFFLFLVIWAGDICAFFVGRTLGRHLLFPRVSPKKTVEGGLGGLAGSLLVAWGFGRWWFWQTVNLKTAILLAALIAVAGQVGDFVESAMKRGAGLKDSGAILPGHGGLLDRIDSLLFGAPALWLAITLRDFWR